MPVDSHYYVFSDASYDPGSKTGVAGFLFVAVDNVPADREDLKFIEQDIELRSFQDTSNTRLEIEAVVLALEMAKVRTTEKIEIFTDCKSAVDLPGRRMRLEAVDFKSKSTGKYLSNADLYRRFFRLMDDVQAQITWIKGHKANRKMGQIDQLFAAVDRTVRKTLRESLEKK